ncbi:Fe-S cluster assembly protein SufD [Marinomonas sp. 15G1-11]|uniref:Fe-S cluster assembly protein SufD n=1 Tax=Marinomonas phaeophyticola TaxID=3004091 RepID=A0ABT4JXV9_9GAMM|nr:Fe-S cluster assembly protein SufD [Marinomonas sp. 15G1-11]MCZ2723118.1 Fe-S cluster assembly protein SufD [Marinomonas sp. 15G1-11]
MSVWLENAIARANSTSDWLSPIRSVSLAALKDTPWPTRKTEAWRYTSLKSLERATLSPSPSVNQDTPEQIDGFESFNLVFRNGEFDLDSLTQPLPAGLMISYLPTASEEMKQASLDEFSQIKPGRHLFGLINDVLAQHVVRIEVAEGVSISQAIRITSLIGLNSESHTRVFVKLNKGASLTVSEHYQGNVESLNTGFVEYDICAEAKLEHYRFALQTDKAISLGGCHFKLGERADLNSTLVGFGSDLSRVDTDIIYDGEFATAKLNAFYLLDGKELFDLHATVEHAVPNCTTLENVRGIVADRAKAVFNGRIHIHRHAQKTLAELNNRNLLLSDKAEINTKPELEIYADDVRCAHGATVAEIDKHALYYLESRGISRSKAQVMLNFGFINELIDQMPNQVLAEWIRPQIRNRFAEMEVTR